MKINTVAIIGAGAIGAYFIWGLHEKLGSNLCIVADGERKARLEKNGLTINGKNYKLNVKTPEEARGADLLLVATKYGALRSALPAIKTITDNHTTVMSLLNGVDSEEIIAECIDPNRILYALMKIAAERRKEEVFFNGPVTPGVFFGEASTKEVSERMQAVADLFEGTDLHYRMCDDIKREMWFKYALNISKNQPQAIIDCGVGAYEDSEHVAFLSKKLHDEVVAVAAKKGIDISDITSVVSTSSNAKNRARYSMLQDLDAGRHTEVDMFAGAMIKMGKEYHVSVPYNEFAYHAIKALEERNDGMFDYK